MNPVPTPIREFNLEITDIAYGGRGVGRFDGKVVFVPHLLIGEVVQVRKVREFPDYITGEIVSILQPSQERIESDCLISVGKDFTGREHFFKAPGCAYQCFSYEEEIRIKDRQFSGFMQPFCKSVGSPSASPRHLHYRNKITLHTKDDHGEIALGYCEEKDAAVVDMPVCPLAVEEINAELAEIRSKQGFKNTIREGMTLTLRYTAADGVKWWRNNPPANSSWLKEKLSIGIISVPCGSFFQVNNTVADILLDKVIAQIRKFSPYSVVDLYCGCGLFSIAASIAGVENIAGLDSDPDSIKAARYNAENFGIKQAVFSADFANSGFSKLVDNHKKTCNYELANSLLIVDPPRSGLGKKVLDIIKNCGFMGIIYVSCSPDTLQRDLQDLTRTGYRVISAEMLDMFPRTAHFESLVVLENMV